MSTLPSIDMHAHIKADLPRSELATLEGIVFAATRSIGEAKGALDRNDERVIWGVGLHPGLVGVQQKFQIERFDELTARSPLVSEVGLDGTSRVPEKLQRENFEAILRSLAERPRITSVHSAGATAAVLESISRIPVPGIVLHWWLGSDEETEQAIKLGCYFSINASARSLALIERVPSARILAETDHPFGDRRERAAARPGNISTVERHIAQHSRSTTVAVRLQSWRNLSELAVATGTREMLPRAVRIQFAAL